MQMLLRLSKLCLLAGMLVGANANAQVSNDHVSYTFVDHKGEEVGYAEFRQHKGISIRQSRPDGRHVDFKISEFDTLARKHDFEFEIVSDTLVASPQGDYFVVEAMRSIATNPSEDTDYVKHPQWWKHRCNHGVNLTYLVRIVRNKAKIVKKNLTECVFQSRKYDRDGQVGFEVRGYGSDDAGRAVIYLLQKDGSFIKKIGGPYKEND